MMRKSGVSSQMLFTAGFVSIGLTVASWMLSKKAEAAGIERADHWGIFIGEWAPTFFALGTAMRLEEHWSGEDVEDVYGREGMRTGTAMPVG
ncbi:hypothetical protein [Actinocorallia populi]|uniref:hypothetical protein n=1 Tax=Actinocorallia populi TaxID=2079200 RepID=UPI001E294985|nr:hypothetical protein [Actinocorallia populi]